MNPLDILAYTILSSAIIFIVFPFAGLVVSGCRENYFRHLLISVALSIGIFSVIWAMVRLSP